ncbi:hypothetical protein V5799_017644 [Amblyomma americanum]|uniref:Ran gtpase-activating protein n=1 Tax=Amblyomma americanum TaxID=6943 RepID=A0AAQ4F1J0_AMBAM
MAYPTTYYHRMAPHPTPLYADMPGFRRACTASSSNDCWLCDVLTSWNSALRYCRLNLREEEPGNLCLESLRGVFLADDGIPRDKAAVHSAAFLLAYLPRQHKCIRRISLRQENLPHQKAPVRPLLGADWWPQQPECNVQYLEISGIVDTDWNILLCGLGRVSALKGLIIERAIITCNYVSKLDQLLAANSEGLQKLVVSAARQIVSAGISDRLIRAISNCTHLTELSFDVNLTTTGVGDLGRLLLSSKNIQKLHLRDQFGGERRRGLLGALSRCVKTNASLLELHYESLSLDVIELLDALKFNGTLKHLVLSGYEHSQKTFGREHGAALGAALATNSGLRSLVISHCTLSELAVEDISAGLALNTSLERFDLSHCKVNFVVASALCRVLYINRTLRMVMLDPDGEAISERARLSEQVAAASCYHRVGMPWDETSMPSLVNALQQPSLCPLECHIDSSRFSIESLSQVCLALVSSTVQSLSVKFIDSNFTQARHHHVHEAIRKNQSIVSLSLQEDSISSGACIFVAKALLKNRTVTKLSLRIDYLSTKAAESLSEILSKNDTLEELLLNCINVDLSCVDVIASGLKENRTLTHFSIVRERDIVSCSTIAVDECVDRNLSSWNCAVQFVLETCISRRRAETFESLQGLPCFVQRVAAASGKSRAEAAAMVQSAKHFIRSNYLFITGVVCQDLCCYPSGHMQVDDLNSECWNAITAYLRVSDVIRH